MSLINLKNIRNAQLGIWKIEEDLSELLALYEPNAEEAATFAAYKSEDRKKEWLATRALLKCIVPNEEVHYSEYGSPRLNNPELKISISHTKEYAALIISKKSDVGLDIERCSQSASNISKRFLSENERSFLSKDERVEHTTLLWSIKEAIFKLHEKGGLTYSEDITIEPFQYNEKGSAFAQLNKNDLSKKYELYYESILDHKLVYCIDNE